MTDRELMQQALSALEWAADAINPENEFDCRCLICTASDALRERLAKQEMAGLTEATLEKNNLTWVANCQHLVNAEREACARVADKQNGDEEGDADACIWSKAARHIAAAIRARGQV